MNLFGNLFGNSHLHKSCPRCLGKGYVDWDDIKRLNQELRWSPGPCVYCNGKGMVDPEMESKIPVDFTYLVTNLSPFERNAMIKGDPEVLESARVHDEQVTHFIDQVCYLYFECGLSSQQIVTFFAIPLQGSDQYEDEVEALQIDVDKIISIKGM